MAHIIVDGYNIIRRVESFLAAEREGIESGRFALLLALEEYAARFGYRVTAVFDGGGRPSHLGAGTPREERFAGIDVVFSGRGESADAAILRLLQDLREKRTAGDGPCDAAEIVVSDDYAIRDEAIEFGAFIKSTDDLFRAMQGQKRLEL
jgi:predicted RNA-binding protein with PIN domain